MRRHPPSRATAAGLDGLAHREQVGVRIVGSCGKGVPGTVRGPSRRLGRLGSASSFKWVRAFWQAAYGYHLVLRRSMAVWAGSPYCGSRTPPLRRTACAEHLLRARSAVQRDTFGVVRGYSEVDYCAAGLPHQRWRSPTAAHGRRYREATRRAWAVVCSVASRCWYPLAGTKICTSVRAHVRDAQRANVLGVRRAKFRQRLGRADIATKPREQLYVTRRS